MKVLCYVNHYVGAPVGFHGRSTDGSTEARREIVRRCLEALRAIPGADVRVCGVPGRATEPLDLEFPAIAHDPKLLVYESLVEMTRHIDEYDYFVNVEDDVLLPVETFGNVIDFDRTSLRNEVLHPNRIEIDDAGSPYCVDLVATPGWAHQRRTFDGREIRVARNPHSAILILSADKLAYALPHLDLAYRGRFLKYEMDSAFAYFNSPFCLYRPYEDLTFHTVTHLDRWAGPRAANRQIARTDEVAAGASSASGAGRSRWRTRIRRIVPGPVLAWQARRRR